MHATPTSALPPLSLRCPACNARLRAARNLIGHVCPCPRCGYRVAVRVALPSDADIALADDTKPDRPALRR